MTPTSKEKGRAVIDLQGCESCSAENPIETMTIMEDCWFCEKCVSEFQAEFDTCQHEWQPHTNTMSEPGRVCIKCNGFVADDLPPLSPKCRAYLARGEHNLTTVSHPKHPIAGELFNNCDMCGGYVRFAPRSTLPQGAGNAR